MTDEEEKLYDRLDAKYGFTLRPVIRRCTIVDAAGVNSYTIRYPDGGQRDQVECVHGIIPQIDDAVRVEILDGVPLITDHIGPRQDPQEVSTAALVTTVSASYTALTGNPQVTLNMIIGQVALITVYARISNNPGGSGHQSFMSFAVSGAETLAATDANAIESQAPLFGEAGSKTTKFVATANGARTFQSQYKTTTGDTASFVNRRIIAVPITSS